MCAPSASIDDVIDHLENREHKIRQSLSFLKLSTTRGNAVTTSQTTFQAALTQTMKAGIMLPASSMK